MEIKVLKNDDGRVRFDGMAPGSCFRFGDCEEDFEYLMKVDDELGVLAVNVEDGRKRNIVPRARVLPVKAKVVIGGDI